MPISNLLRLTAPQRSRQRPVRAVVGRFAGAVLSALLVFGACAHAHDEGEMFKLDFTKAPPDVLVWGELAKVGVQRHHGKYQITLLPPVLALDGKQVTMYGYMTPVGPGDEHKKFLLSMAPLNCPGCTTVTGPEGIVEVNVDKPQATTTEPVAVRGTMNVLKDDPDGLIYRIVDGEVVQAEAENGAKNASTLQAQAKPEANDSHHGKHEHEHSHEHEGDSHQH